MRKAIILILLLGIAFPALLIDSGEVEGPANITLLIYPSETSAVPIFSATFKTNGSWEKAFKVNLEEGKLYWKDYRINGKDIDFCNGMLERRPFLASREKWPNLLFQLTMTSCGIAENVSENARKLSHIKVENDTLWVMQPMVIIGGPVIKGVKSEKSEDYLVGESYLDRRMLSIYSYINETRESLLEEIKKSPKSFLELNDTPDSYEGRDGYILVVKEGKGIVFRRPSSLFHDEVGARKFLELTDTPNSYTGHAGEFLRVNAGENGLEFVPGVLTDELVKADPSDPTAGYLSAKVDSSTIEVDTANHWLQVKDSGITSSKIAPNSILSSHIVDNEIRSIDIKDGEIVDADISPSANIKWSKISKVGSSIKDLGDVDSSMSPVPGEVLTWTGTEWTSQPLPPSATPGGGDGAVQFNDGGSFGGDENQLYWDKTNNRLGIGTNTPSAKLHVENGEIWLFNNNLNTRFVIGDTPTTGDYGWLQWDSANDYFRIDTSDGPSNGLKVKNNTAVIGNIYPNEDYIFIAGNNTQEWFSITKKGNVILSNASDASYVRLNIYTNHSFTPFRVEEKISKSLLLFGVHLPKYVNITINNPSSTVTNYSLLLTINYLSGMRPDFGDLKFSLVSGSSEMPIQHWVESYTPGVSAKVWVNIPALPSGTTMLRMYFGNPSLNDLGSPYNVFIFYDDFDRASLGSAWTFSGSPGSYSLTSGVLRLWNNWGGCCDGSCYFNAIRTSETFDLPLTVSIRFRQDPYTPLASCGRTGPAILFDTRGEAIVSTSTGSAGYALRLGSAYTSGSGAFPSGWQEMNVTFQTNEVKLESSWFSTPKTFSSVPVANTPGWIGIAGDTDSNSVYDEIDYIIVRRPFISGLTVSFSTVGNTEEESITVFIISNKGRVGIKTESPEYDLDVNGTMAIRKISTGSGIPLAITPDGEVVKTSSSKKNKEHITNLTVDSSKIYNLTVKSFVWKDTGEESFGLIAEEVENVLPEVIIYNNGTPEGVDYIKVEMLMLEEIKKLKKEIEELKEKMKKCGCMEESEESQEEETVSIEDGMCES